MNLENHPDSQDTPTTPDPSPAPEDSSVLSKNQLKNEAKKKAKLEKFQAKQTKLSSAAAAAAADGTAAGKEGKSKNKRAGPGTCADQTPLLERGDWGDIDKKLKAPIPTAYDPAFVEAGWNEWWEQKGLFKPRFQTNGEPMENGTFVIPIPPPNVTGSLHLGHALTISIQDTLIRYHRMLGKTVLYNPGCDHAGIATQSVVEKRLWKTTKQTRHDLGREAFLAKVWEWKDTYEQRIYGQLRRLGGSFDWSRARFTMDPSLSAAVTHAFLRLHADGTIYRSTRLVNWCSFLTTALSNLEVENRELQGRTQVSVPGYTEPVEFGTLVHFAYPLAENPEEVVVVATTRLETMLGDVAVAVHPDDPRYAAQIGKLLRHPFFPDRILPVIADTYVDPAFGTGAVKITPAHDFNDFDVGKRHGLPCINLLDDDGTLNANAGPFVGLPRFAARTRILAALKDRGLFRKVEDHAMVLPVCSRSGEIIEPRLKPQWYVRCGAMAQRAMEAVRSGDLEIVPRASEREWFRWLEQIQDWCISRQLWWGHRVPAYFVKMDGDVEQDPEDTAYWVVAASREDADEKARAKFPGKKYTLMQDEDVLDTWFSSGLWPFAIFGWPERTPDFAHFYPTSLLETGWDILFFWVARMAMLGLHLTDKVPFRQVFCHAMVRDAHGRKMSKSLGNVIDPVDVLDGISLAQLQARLEEGNLDPREVARAKLGQQTDFPNGIPACGADALRFALCAYTSAGRDINLDILRVEGYRKFCNKVWQACRFALARLGDPFQVPFDASAPQAHFTALLRDGTLGAPEQWILGKLGAAAESVRGHLEQMNFMAATSVLHHYWQHELCDVFLEMCKDQVYRDAHASLPSTLYLCLDHGLKLLHPLMPFVTEELWQRLPRAPDAPPSLMVARYPSRVLPEPAPALDTAMDLLLETARQARSLATDYPVASAHFFVHFPDPSHTHRVFLHTHTSTLCALLKPRTTLEFAPPPATGCITVAFSPDFTLALRVKGEVDLPAELEKLTSKINKAQAAAHALRVLQAKPQYQAKVKEEVQQADQTKLHTLEREIEQLGVCMENFLKLVDA